MVHMLLLEQSALEEGCSLSLLYMCATQPTSFLKSLSVEVVNLLLESHFPSWLRQLSTCGFYVTCKWQCLLPVVHMLMIL